jgi:UDP-3-O-[3-hydroxymyristoyl] glucosamine N-acyltransferase
VVGARVRLGARPVLLGGIPAAPDKQAKRQMIALTQLPDLIRRTRELEKQVAELKTKAGC